MNKFNLSLMVFASIAITVFGSLFIYNYIQDSEISVDHLIGIVLGAALLTGTLFWRKQDK